MTTPVETKTVNGSTSKSAGPSLAPPPKLRRRPMMWMLGVALIALGGLMAAWIATSLTNSESVLALRENVDRGEVIEESDLMAVQISGDPTIDTFLAGQEFDVIGKRAGRDLTAGSLVPPAAITNEVIPAAGESLVGVALTKAQLPSTALRSGDVVRVINTPRAQDDVGKPGEAMSIEATVVGSSILEDSGQIVVDVTVPTQEAARLATLVATGRVAVVLDGGL